MRLDQLLVTRGLAPTRTKAQALILAGRVSSRGARLDKPGVKVDPDAPLDVVAPSRHVSRSGAKLLGALASFGLDVRGREALDVGASTGGFTQVLLEAGARRVVALDVGHGQLDWSLRQDPRVVAIEGINARYLRAAELPCRPSLAVIDVSFISLERVLPAIFSCLEPGGDVVALVKPQFEVGRGKVGRGGIVRDPELHREVLRRITRFVRVAGGAILALAPSPIPGAEGNTEFFVRLSLGTGGLGEEAIDLRIDDLTAHPSGGSPA